MSAQAFKRKIIGIGFLFSLTVLTCLDLRADNASLVETCFDVLALDDPTSVADLVNILNLQIPSEQRHSFNQMQPASLDNVAYAEENVAERIRQIFTNHYFEQRVISCPENQHWRLWVAPFAEKVRQYGHELLHGYKERFIGFSAAVDYRKKRLWIFSAGFSFADVKVKVPHEHIKADFKTYAGTLGTAWSNTSWYADAQFSFLYSPVDTQRKMRFEAEQFPALADLKFKAKHYDRMNQVMGHFGGGYDFKIRAGHRGTVNVFPFVNVDYIYLLQSGYREKGADSLNLRVHGKSYDLLRPEGGFGIGYNGCFKHIEVMLDLSASYVLEFRLLGKGTRVRFKEDQGCHFSVHGLNPENNLIAPEARLRLASTNFGFSLTLGYHGEFGDYFRQNAVEAEIRQTF